MKIRNCFTYINVKYDRLANAVSGTNVRNNKYNKKNGNNLQRFRFNYYIMFSFQKTESVRGCRSSVFRFTHRLSKYSRFAKTLSGRKVIEFDDKVL